jgi:hypothetical protein
MKAMLYGNGPPGTIVGTQYFVLTRLGTFNGADVFTGNHSMLLWIGGGGGGFNVVRSNPSGLMIVEASAIGFWA